MSVRSGIPVRARMSARARSPASRPGPRNDVMEVLFALSKDALKMTGTSQRLAISRIAAAVSSACEALSMTHGPRMKASGCPPPTEKDPIRTGFTVPILSIRRRPDVRRLQPTGLVAIARFDEAREERMRRERLRLELGMELDGDEPRMRRQLRDLDELAVGRAARHLHPVLRERRLVETIEFEAMPMPLVDQIAAVDSVRDRSGHEFARVASQSHRAAELVDAEQVAQLVDHLVRRVFVHLG